VSKERLMRMKRWILIACFIIGLIGLGITTSYWATPFLQFLGTNSDVIQALADLIGILCYLGSLITFVYGIRLQRSQRERPMPSESIARDTTPTGPASHSTLSSGSQTRRERLGQRYHELQQRWSGLTTRIQAVTDDLSNEMDGERKYTLKQRLAALQDERNRLETELSKLERQLE